MTLDEALSALDRARYDDALALASVARDSGDAATRATALLALSRLHRERAAYTEARSASAAALDLAPDDQERRDALIELANVEFEVGDAAAARRAFDRADGLGAGPPTAAMRHLAGHLAREERGEREALAVFEAVLADATVSVRDRFEIELHAAELLASLDRREEASALVAEARARAKSLGATHWLCAMATAIEGALRQREGHYQQAHTLYERALAIDEALFEPDHPRVLADRARIAAFVASQGRQEEAATMLESVVRGTRARSGERSPLLIPILRDLGWIMLNRGKLRAAEHELLAALSLGQSVRGRTDPVLVPILRGLALVERNRGESERGIAYLSHAREICSSPRWFDPVEAVNVTNDLALMHFDREELDAAEALQREVVSADLPLPPDHPWRARWEMNLARTLAHADKLDEAEAVLARAMPKAESAYGPDSADAGHGLQLIGFIALGRGAVERAEEAYRRSLDVYARALGPDSPVQCPSLWVIARIREARGDVAGAVVSLERAKEIYAGAKEPYDAVLDELARLEQLRGRSAVADRYRALAEAQRQGVARLS